MNKSGQVFLVSLMIAIVFIILGLAFSPSIKEFTDNARNQTNGDTVGLDCGNSSISNFDKGTCMFVDLYNPYFAGFLIFAAGAIIFAKIIGAV